jgi:hypothetical protein
MNRLHRGENKHYNILYPGENKFNKRSDRGENDFKNRFSLRQWRAIEEMLVEKGRLEVKTRPTVGSTAIRQWTQIYNLATSLATTGIRR